MQFLDNDIEKLLEKVCNKVLARVMGRLDKVERSIGRIEMRQIQNADIKNPGEAEFQVSSQWGEDGIIQYLINRIPIERKIFIEFGVENYRESNTRFLLQNNNWSGLVLDGSEKNINFIKSDHIYWRYNLKAEKAFINRDNINDLFKNAGITGDIGILSIDIDGNDYWVFEQINVVSPRIIICEYNSIWGAEKKVTMPYDENFIRTQKHYSNLYYGASISALTDLANKKGYSLITSNFNGNNIFFVRNDLIDNLKVLSPQEAYVKASFRESRDENGTLTFLNFEDARDLIKDLELLDIEKNETIKVSSL